MVELVVVGGGRMGEALVGGLLGAGWAPDGLAVAEVDAGRRAQLVDRFPGVAVVAEPVAAGAAVLAVKPGDAESAARALAAAGVPRVLSIAAGVPLHRLAAAVGDGVAVLRAMPNTPALIGAGASALAVGADTAPGDVAWARSILETLGVVVEVPEGLLDAVTGLSGSGPAYVFLFAEALIEAGVLVGLPRDTSRTLVVQTLLGSARLLAEGSEGPEALRAQVTSPGGTTAAGLRALEGAALRSAVLDAVAAATRRSQELGGADSSR